MWQIPLKVSLGWSGTSFEMKEANFEDKFKVQGLCQQVQVMGVTGGGAQCVGLVSDRRVQ